MTDAARKLADMLRRAQEHDYNEQCLTFSRVFVVELERALRASTDTSQPQPDAQDLARASELLLRYAAVVRACHSHELERFDYLPEIEEAAENVLAVSRQRQAHVSPTNGEETSNHLQGTYPMSDTPRTDALLTDGQVQGPGAYRMVCFARRLERELAEQRNAITEECARAIESAPLTYAGPDPQGVQDLRYLIVCAIRDLKAKV